FVDIDFEPFWQELKARLLEELDYAQEARNATRMAQLYADDPHIIVPRVIPEASGRRVLTMEFVPGIHPDEACSDRHDDALRSVWGERHLGFVIRGLMEHCFLHADPNFGNYAFREDGTMVVYDHGCVKNVSADAAAGCANVLGTILDQDVEALADALHALGVYDRRTGERVPLDVIEPIGDELMSMVDGTPYRFSGESTLYDTLLGESGRYLAELSRMELPPELTFVNRTLTGVFGNLCRLQARADWHGVLAPYRPNV
ncbi:MAG: AarF/UbiB family protein, partial [Pseudomonadota bacterium]